jgi:hypothetical protein
VEDLLSGSDALTVDQLVDGLRSRLEAIDLNGGGAIADIKDLLDLATALVYQVRSADLRTRNEAGKLKTLVERAAGQWINLHPESLE